MISVKTQYAGMEIHHNVIQLFRYLNEKYLADFTMSDEGQYWETNDLNVLKPSFGSPEGDFLRVSQTGKSHRSSVTLSKVFS